MRTVTSTCRNGEWRDHEATQGDTRSAILTSPVRSAIRQILGRVQRKPIVGAHNDKYEQEADWVAEMVMREPAPALDKEDQEDGQIVVPAVSSPGMQAIYPQYEEALSADEASKLHAQVASVGVQAPSVKGTGVIEEINGYGQPLSLSIRAFFEPRFGVDLHHVHVHANDRSDRAAQSINAVAFTLGSEIFFRNGEYRPETLEGRGLIAHELTHVIQQHSTGQYSLHRKTGAEDESESTGVVPWNRQMLEEWYRNDLKAIRTSIDECDKILVSRGECVAKNAPRINKARIKFVIGMNLLRMVEQGYVSPPHNENLPAWVALSKTGGAAKHKLERIYSLYNSVYDKARRGVTGSPRELELLEMQESNLGIYQRFSFSFDKADAQRSHQIAHEELEYPWYLTKENWP